jgi:hypothetical protein
MDYVLVACDLVADCTFRPDSVQRLCSTGIGHDIDARLTLQDGKDRAVDDLTDDGATLKSFSLWT